MYHHLERAKDIFQSRGAKSLLRTSLTYVPIEINNFIFRRQFGSGTMVMSEDWDTLILLDACRYDMFSNAIDMEGRLESRISQGSTSEEFLDRNFGEGTFHDTVYVNANGYLPKLGLDQDNTFHSVIDLLDNWDSELRTVQPQTVRKKATEAHRRYPNKRIIVHFMQPHIPFITEEGIEFQKQLEKRSIWRVLRSGNADVDLDQVWKLYEDNLDLVLDSVSKLLDEISGKIVISADHGNLVGERQRPIPTSRMYGHPWGVYSPELVKVPWFIIDSRSRRQIEPSPPEDSKSLSDDKVQDRLEALGYT